ncbi:MAG: sensor histidine kinase, partial [Planctomycetota bacterium]
RRDAGEETAADLDFLLSEMARLDHSVEELLFHAGTPRYELADVDLRVALEETVRSLSPLADHLGVGLDAETPAEAVPARADLGKVRQALTNLVLNALQASGPESRVAVRLRVEGGKAVLEVADGGDGVPQEIAERVFEPFVTGREGGTGLGLAVTRAIAGAHAGEVAFAREGETTLFTLRLPLGEG